MNSKDVLQKDELDSNKSKSVLINIQSYYFFQKLFGNIPQKRAFEIMKINKNIQNRLNININNYIEYCELYTPIEIELIHLQNNSDFFINIPPEDRQYYHIYFNDNKEKEIKNLILYNEKVNISKINIRIDY